MDANKTYNYGKMLNIMEANIKSFTVYKTRIRACVSSTQSHMTPRTFSLKETTLISGVLKEACSKKRVLFWT